MHLIISNVYLCPKESPLTVICRKQVYDIGYSWCKATMTSSLPIAKICTSVFKIAVSFIISTVKAECVLRESKYVFFFQWHEASLPSKQDLYPVIYYRAETLCTYWGRLVIHTKKHFRRTSHCLIEL
jgi:hypothetical protein